jgi:mannose-6-phosphate isomerase-like protein (cupin superfamily)
MDLGKKLREERRRRMLTVQEISKVSGLSKNYIIQIEKGRANPSIGALKKITDALKTPLATLFEDPSVENHYNNSNCGKEVFCVKRGRRKMMKMPSSEVEYFLLSPDLNRKIEFLLTIAKPGVSSGNDFFSHDGEECGVVVKGKVEFTVGGKKFIMEEGDSIYFSSSLPHRWKNVGDVPVELVWAITPPSF